MVFLVLRDANVFQRSRQRFTEMQHLVLQQLGIGLVNSAHAVSLDPSQSDWLLNHSLGPYFGLRVWPHLFLADFAEVFLHLTVLLQKACAFFGPFKAVYRFRTGLKRLSLTAFGLQF